MGKKKHRLHKQKEIINQDDSNFWGVGAYYSKGEDILHQLCCQPYFLLYQFWGVNVAYL